ncbi:MAG: KpsF/GutQ family sugar-phosphate isomerase [Candidatus Paceibacterota bacterium]|jgi:arabinose-5-phosphate isomerase
MKKEDILKKVVFALRKEEEAVSGIHKLLNRNFFKAVDILDNIKGKIVISGIGKSGHIGIKIASTLTSLGVPSVYLNPAEAIHGDLGLVSADDAILAISSSGETKELIRVIRHIEKQLGIPVVSITCNPKSSLVKVSEVSLVFRVREEGSPFNLAPMASTTASLVIGDLLATALSVKNGFSKKDFADFHPGGSLGLRLTKVRDLLKKGKPMPIVKESDSFGRVLKVMSDKKLGITAVIDKKRKLVGVISDGDIRRFLLTGKFSDRSLARDAMSAGPKVIKEEESLEEALVKMESYKVTSLFVTGNHGNLLGIVTMHDIVENKIL